MGTGSLHRFPPPGPNLRSVASRFWKAVTSTEHPTTGALNAERHGRWRSSAPLIACPGLTSSDSAPESTFQSLSPAPSTSPARQQRWPIPRAADPPALHTGPRHFAPPWHAVLSLLAYLVPLAAFDWAYPRRSLPREAPTLGALMAQAYAPEDPYRPTHMAAALCARLSVRSIGREPAAPGPFRAQVGLGLLLYDFLFFWVHLALHKERLQPALPRAPRGPARQPNTGLPWRCSQTSQRAPVSSDRLARCSSERDGCPSN